MYLNQECILSILDGGTDDKIMNRWLETAPWQYECDRFTICDYIPGKQLWQEKTYNAPRSPYSVSIRKCYIKYMEYNQV